MLCCSSLTDFNRLRRLRTVAAAINRYKHVGIWEKNPQLPRIGYECLKKSIISSGFVLSGTAYEQAVDNSFAEAIIKEDPPAIVR
jgi:hypothetical protein